VPPGEAAGSRIQGPQLDGELTGLGASATNLVATYDNAGAPHAELRDPQYTLVNPIGITGVHAVVGSTASTFAIVTQQVSGKPKFALFDGNGKSKCGPVEIGDATFVPSAVAGGDSGFLVVSSGHVRGQVISGSCTPGPIFEIDSGSASESRVAAGKRGYAVVWSDATTALPWRRFFGSRICN
jgi:hypothetical protein